MYKKILVPLDGSELAECVMPHVRAIALGCQTPSVVLVRVVEPFQVPASSEIGFSAQMLQRIESEQTAEARDYMARAAERAKKDGLTVTTEVLYGRAAEVLATYAEKNGVDLIIVATHGRSGMSRFVWGSVADRLLRSASVPVMMVRSPKASAPSSS